MVSLDQIKLGTSTYKKKLRSNGHGRDNEREYIEKAWAHDERRNNDCHI